MAVSIRPAKSARAVVAGAEGDYEHIQYTALVFIDHM